MDITRFIGVSTVLVILYSVQATAIIEETIEVMRCVEKLMPCRPYVNSDITPPSWCCDPMKEIVEKDVTCLCEAFNHPDMLALIKLTQESAISLVSSCGAKYDASRCSSKAASSSAASPGSMTSGSASASTTKNAALVISFLGFSFISALRGL